MEKIEYPHHLNKHSLSEQELALLNTPESKALAKDWNIINRKVDWLIKETVVVHNILVEHDRVLETWKRVYWLGGLLIGSGGVIAFIIRFFNV
jgi:hypothetical protein